MWRDADDADLCAEMARIGGDLAGAWRRARERATCTLRTLLIGRRQQLMRERQDDVDIRHVEELLELLEAGVFLASEPINSREGRYSNLFEAPGRVLCRRLAISV